MKYFIGIDPGLTGAAALMDNNGGLLEVLDLPVIRDGATAWIDGDEFAPWIDKATHQAGNEYPVAAWIERVHAMPKQGVSSAFNFGVTFGSILGVLRTKFVTINFVQPAKWKRDMGLSKDKNASRDKAKLLYPTADVALAKHDGRAEAILIAHWARTCAWKAPQ